MKQHRNSSLNFISKYWKIEWTFRQNYFLQQTLRLTHLNNLLAACLSNEALPYFVLSLFIRPNISTIIRSAVISHPWQVQIKFDSFCLHWRCSPSTAVWPFKGEQLWFRKMDGTWSRQVNTGYSFNSLHFDVVEILGRVYLIKSVS